MFNRQTQVKLPERCDGLAPRQPTWHSTPRCAADARATVQPHASAGAVATPRACHFDAGKLRQSSLHRQLGTRARGHLARGATDARATAHPQPSARSHRRKIRSTLVVPLVGRDVVPQVILQSSPPFSKATRTVGGGAAGAAGATSSIVSWIVTTPGTVRGCPRAIVSISLKLRAVGEARGPKHPWRRTRAGQTTGRPQNLLFQSYATNPRDCMDVTGTTAPLQ